jgi:hypothetical protein
MIGGGKKFEKSEKSKFKPNREKESFREVRKKHKDKATYRMLRNEEEDVS